MDDQGLGIADVGQVAGQLYRVDEGPGRLVPARHAEGQHRPEPVAQVALGQLMGGMGRQSGEAHPVDQRMCIQPPGQLEGIVDVALHPQRQRLQSLQEQERVEGTERGAEVAETLDPSPDGEGDVAEGPVRSEHLGEDQAVVPGRRFGEEGELAVAPVEIARVDDHPTDRIAVPADPLGGGRHHDVGPVVDGTDQIAGAAEGVVDDQRDPVAVGDSGELLQVRDQVLGIGDRFDVEGFGAVGDGSFQLVGVDRLDEGDVDAETGEGHLELVVGTAIQIARRHDLVSSLGDGGQGQQLGGLPGGGGHRRCPTFESGDALLEDVGGGVHDPRVDVPELLQAEQAGGVVGVVEGVRRGLVDRYRPGVGAGGRLLAGVDLQCLESVFRAHGSSPPVVSARGFDEKTASMMVRRSRRSRSFLIFPAGSGGQELAPFSARWLPRLHRACSLHLSG